MKAVVKGSDMLENEIVESLRNFHDLAKEHAIRLDDIMETMFLLVINQVWKYTDQSGQVLELDQETLDRLYVKRRLSEKDLSAFNGGWQPASDGAPADREAPALAQADETVYLFGGLNEGGALAGPQWRLRSPEDRAGRVQQKTQLGGAEPVDPDGAGLARMVRAQLSHQPVGERIALAFGGAAGGALQRRAGMVNCARRAPIHKK